MLPLPCMQLRMRGPDLAAHIAHLLAGAEGTAAAGSGSSTGSGGLSRGMVLALLRYSPAMAAWSREKLQQRLAALQEQVGGWTERAGADSRAFLLCAACVVLAWCLCGWACGPFARVATGAARASGLGGGGFSCCCWWQVITGGLCGAFVELAAAGAAAAAWAGAGAGAACRTCLHALLYLRPGAAHRRRYQLGKLLLPPTCH